MLLLIAVLSGTVSYLQKSAATVISGKLSLKASTNKLKPRFSTNTTQQLTSVPSPSFGQAAATATTATATTTTKLSLKARTTKLNHFKRFVYLIQSSSPTADAQLKPTWDRDVLYACFQENCVHHGVPSEDIILALHTSWCTGRICVA